MKIIDVSKYQGSINFKKVKASGIDGVIIKAGYGRGNIEPTFKKYIEDAIAAGIKYIGAYWFSYAYTVDMARREAQYCNDVISPYKDKMNLGVYFDWEYDSMEYAKKVGIACNKTLITNMNLYFCRKITDLGYKAGYYLNQDYSLRWVDESRLKSYRRWFAKYTTTEQTGCFMWQYSSKGKVDGIAGYVDMNKLLGSVVEVNAKPKQKKKTNAEIAQEVLDGKWGNGSERKQRLTAAGYDYNAIQSLVNKQLAPSEDGVFYIVKKGDTLSKIAQAYGTTVTLLKKRNNIKDVNKIYVGQKLRIR